MTKLGLAPSEQGTDEMRKNRKMRAMTSSLAQVCCRDFQLRGEMAPSMTILLVALLMDPRWRGLVDLGKENN
jgi:hypothetical protein